MAIVMRADPYTVVIVPNVRGPVSYQTGYGFKVSVGELSKIDQYRHPEIMTVSGTGPGFLMSAQRLKFMALSGSGNVLHIYAFTRSAVLGSGVAGGGDWDEVASGYSLSNVPLRLEVVGH